MHEHFRAEAKFSLINSRYARWMLLSCLLFLSAACSGGFDVGPSVENAQLLVKEAGDAEESTAGALHGSTVSGTIYVYVEPHPRISQVEFYLNDPGQEYEPLKSVSREPFALTLDTTILRDGKHTLTSIILVGRRGNNTKTASEASFTVQNGQDGSGDADDEPEQDWSSTDIGDVGTAGSVSQHDGTFILSVASGDIWGEADSFHFTYQTIAGDGQIIARITHLDEADRSTKAGVMIRASLDEDAKNAMMYLNVPSRERAAFSYRPVDAGETTNTPLDAGMPWYVKLVRQGDTIIGYASAYGDTWVEVDRTSISLPEQAYVGLAVSSRDDTEIAEGHFESVSVGEVSTTPAINIGITPEDVELEVGQSTTFTATVSGTSVKEVIWSASAGTITADGEYTAPQSSGNDVVTATSKADPDVSDSATVLVRSSSGSPEGRSDFSLRGDPDFDESQLSEEGRLWYRRVWNAIEHPDAFFDLPRLADSGNLRDYGYPMQQSMLFLFTAIRATGDLALVDLIADLSDRMADNLVTQWRDPDTGSWYDPDDGTAGYRRFILDRDTMPTFDGKDTNRTYVYKPHAIIAIMAYMFEVNRDTLSPTGVDYGVRADFWMDYLINDFEAIWHIRNGTSHPKDFFTYSDNVGASTLHSQLTYHYYMYKLTGDTGRRALADKEAQTIAEAMYVADTTNGSAMIFSQRIRDHTEALSPIVYARYFWGLHVDLVLQGHPLFADPDYMEMHARSLAYFVMDNETEDLAFDIGGMEDRSGTNWLDGATVVTIRTKNPWDTSSLEWSREPISRYAISFMTHLAAFGEHERIMDISTQIHAMRESDVGNPRHLAIPSGMLLAAAAQR